MKKSTMIWVGVGIVALLAIPVILLANRRKDKDDSNIKSKKKPKGSILVGELETITEEEFKKNIPAPRHSGGLIKGIEQAIFSLPTYEVISKGKLPMRIKKDVNSDIVGTLESGEKVKGSVAKDGWVQIAKGKGGFVREKNLKKVADGAAAIK